MTAATVDQTLFVLAVATSIDALDVEISYLRIDAGSVRAMAFIGATTFALSYPAVLLGRRLGEPVGIGGVADLLG